jgi:hypothetical protein
MDTPGPGMFKISEKYLAEWFDWGYANLVAYLAVYAKFDAWLTEHPERSLDG